MCWGVLTDALPNATLTGDAWLGLFKSFNGGQTWQSTLIPGYPQDRTPEGLASPLKGFTTASDPVVRSGTNGLFYYAGIAFDRASSQGAVFVCGRLADGGGDVTEGRLKRLSLTDEGSRNG
jgi:hypothetical protein